MPRRRRPIGLIRPPPLPKPTVLHPKYFSAASPSFSLQTISTQPASPAPSRIPSTPPPPLSSLLPPSQNPSNTAVDLICSNLKRHLPPNSPLPAPLHPEQESHLLPHLGNHEITKVLLRSQSQPLLALHFFNWAKTHLQQLDLSPQNYCILVHILTWSRKFSHAIGILSELVQIHRDGDELFHCLVQSSKDCIFYPGAVFGMLVKVYVNLGRVGEALETLRRALGIGFIPGIENFNCLLNGLSKTNCLDQCWEVYQKMRSVEVLPNSYTFNILTHTLCKGGDASRAMEFLEEMESEGFNPDLVTYNTLIDGYCRKGRTDDAFYLYRIMYRRGVQPDLITYTALMNGLCREGKVKDAHQLFHQMVHRGLSPDNFSYNVLISGYCKEGKMKESRRLLEQMIQCGLLPDHFTCHALVNGYQKGGKSVSCLNMVVRLKRLGVSISFEIYKCLIRTLCEENRPNAARSTLEFFLRDGHEANSEIYDILIDAFCKSHHGMLQALELRNEMILKGIRPKLSSYQVLVSCLCKFGETMKAELLMEEMLGFGLMPDSVICVALINGYCKERDYDKAECLLISLAKKLQICDTDSYNIIIEAHCNEGNVTKSFELQDRMLKLGFTPNWQTCKSLISGLSRAR